MERMILRGLLYLFLPYVFFSFVGPSGQYSVEDCVKSLPILVVISALAISARTPKATLWEWLSEKPEPTSEARREAGEARPAKVGGLRSNA